MRRLCATVMTIVVGWQAIGAAASAADVGPIERAAITEATRLAIEMPAPSVPGSWLGMRRRPSPGDSIAITTVAGTRTRTFVALDQVSLTVLNLHAPGLTEPVRHDLLRLAQTNPGVIVDAASGMPKRYHNIQFGPAGIVVEHDKVAELGEVIETLTREHVFGISRSVRRGSAVATSLAAVGGLYLGWAIVFRVGESECNCDGVESLVMIGTPIAAAFGAWWASSHLAEEVLYSHDDLVFRRP